VKFGKFLVPNLAEKDKPLRGLPPKRPGQELQKAFTFRLKQELSFLPGLQPYKPNKELRISADASSEGIGAVMLQKHEQVFMPLAYVSSGLFHMRLMRYSYTISRTWEKSHYSRKTFRD